MSKHEILEFSSKPCKVNYHNQCSGQWEGFGFQIVCNCECHKKLVLGRDESLPNIVNRPTSKSGDYEL